MKEFPKTYKDYDFLLKNNYTISDLKLIGQNLKFKVKAKHKKEMLEESYQYIKKSYYVNKIQKLWRNHFIRSFNISQGPAIFKRKICNNVDDFLTTENMDEISYYFFISFKDIDGFIYGFNIISIYNLIDKNNSMNPYTRNTFSKEFIDLINKRIRYNHILKQVHHSIYDEKPIITIDQKIMTLFQHIDELGNYTQHEWFTNLDTIGMRRFILELYNIWHHRSQLETEIKYIICPPNGTPFYNIPIHTIQYNNNLDINQLKNLCYEIIHRFINSATLRENQAFGAYYILTALTLVSRDAAEALPWLYYSVA
jgi:hypothetical protein